MGLSVTIGVLLISLMSWPLQMVLHKLGFGLASSSVTVSVVLCVVLVGGLAVWYLFKREFKTTDPHMYVFAALCWIHVSGFGVALDLDGYKIGLLTPLYSKAEPYIDSSYVRAVLYFAGLVHVPLLLLVIYFYTNRRSCREVSIFYISSVLSAMTAFLPGLATGKHPLVLGALRHVVVAVVLLVILARLLHKRPFQARPYQFLPLWKRPVAFLFVLYFVLAACAAVFRGIAVTKTNIDCLKNYTKTYEPFLNESSNFPKYQVLMYEYFFVAYYLFALYGLVCSGQHWMSDWSLIHAAAAFQTQATYILASLYHHTAKNMHPPMTGSAAYVFWGLNLTLLVIPQLFAAYCRNDPENFGETHTVDLAQPVKTYTLSSRRSEYLQQKSE